jgi:HK97 family phage major capsid protein
MTTSNVALAQRADVAISDLTTDGGYLQPEQADAFIDMIMETPTVLKQSRHLRMNKPETKIDRMGFGSRIFHAAPQGSSPFADDDGTNDRHLAAAKRSKPTTAQISVTTKEYMAEVHVPYEVLEDNIERGGFEAHLMRQIATRAAVDFEELALWSDTASGDADLLLQDGWLKRMTAHVVNNASAGISPDMFVNGMLAMPQKYLRDLALMRHFVTVANTIRYRQKVAQRATGYGDTMLQQAAPIFAGGVAVEAAPMLAAAGTGNVGFMTFPQNLIFGIRRDIQVESVREIRAREIIVVVTARLGFQIDDGDAAVKFTNI